MAITLDGVTLSPDLIWANKYESPTIGQSVITTLGGGTVVQTMPVTSGTVIKLTAQQRGSKHYGYYTTQQLDDIQTIETSGTSVVFTYDTETLTVIVITGSISVTPFLAQESQPAADYWGGSISLLVI